MLRPRRIPFASAYHQARRMVRGYLLGDKFERNAARWFLRRGDATLRLNYPLLRHSVVFDCGGYEGEWAAAIHEKHGCRVFVFEPVERYVQVLRRRFRDEPAIRVHSFGLHARNEHLLMHLADNASSLFGTSDATEKVELREFGTVLRELSVQQVDLMKLNIEGGEFDLLEHLLVTGLVSRIHHIQVQFHRFVPNAIARRASIRKKLSATHSLTYDYEFIWESWTRRWEASALSD